MRIHFSKQFIKNLPIPRGSHFLILAMLLVLPLGAEETQNQELSTLDSAQLLRQSREAYTIFDRTDLSKALAAKGADVIPELGKALDDRHWHVRHCALLALKELGGTEANRSQIKALLPKLTKLLQDPSIGVRITSTECIGGLGELAKSAQVPLAKAAFDDSEPWVRAAASSALTSVKADPAVMLPLYESMILSTVKEARGEGVSKAVELQNQGVDIKRLVPALMEVFRNPIYDANFSEVTRVPAMHLLKKINVDTSQLVPFIVKDLKTGWKIAGDGYHPYQKFTLGLFGVMGADAKAAIPVLEEIIADPSLAGCDQGHPDYSTFISISQESILRIRMDLEK